MLPAEDLFVHCYAPIDDLIKNGLVVIPADPDQPRRAPTRRS